MYSGVPPIFLQDYPQFFIFDPPSLRHRVTFNVSQVLSSFSLEGLSFSCGFMDGDDDRDIVNSTAIVVLVQEGNIKATYTAESMTHSLSCVHRYV